MRTLKYLWSVQYTCTSAVQDVNKEMTVMKHRIKRINDRLVNLDADIDSNGAQLIDIDPFAVLLREIDNLTSDYINKIGD